MASNLLCPQCNRPTGKFMLATIAGHLLYVGTTVSQYKRKEYCSERCEEKAEVEFLVGQREKLQEVKA